MKLQSPDPSPCGVALGRLPPWEGPAASAPPLLLGVKAMFQPVCLGTPSPTLTLSLPVAAPPGVCSPAPELAPPILHTCCPLHQALVGVSQPGHTPASLSPCS